MNIRANLRDVLRVLLETGPRNSNAVDLLVGLKKEPLTPEGTSDPDVPRKDRVAKTRWPEHSRAIQSVTPE